MRGPVAGRRGRAVPARQPEACGVTATSLSATRRSDRSPRRSEGLHEFPRHGSATRRERPCAARASSHMRGGPPVSDTIRSASRNSGRGGSPANVRRAHGEHEIPSSGSARRSARYVVERNDRNIRLRVSRSSDRAPASRQLLVRPRINGTHTKVGSPARNRRPRSPYTQTRQDCARGVRIGHATPLGRKANLSLRLI